MALITYFLSLILIGFATLYFYLRRYHGYLETTGLPVVPAFGCFGSPPYAFHCIHYHQWFSEKFQKLGKTFARYQGVTPAIISIDPEFIKEVVVKQFDNFTDVISDDIPLPPEQTTLDAARGDTWRALRKMLTPTFTSGKLKGESSIKIKVNKYISHTRKVNSTFNQVLNSSLTKSKYPDFD